MKKGYIINDNSALPTLVCDDFKPFKSEPNWQLSFLDLKIAITIHVFYVDVFKDMLGFLENIKFINPVLLISTDTEEKSKNIKNILEKTNFKYKIKTFKNIGRDIAPSFIGFKEDILKSKYFLHLHTKKSEYNHELSTWRDDILFKLLGSEETVRRNLSLMTVQDIGTIVPMPPDFIKPHMNWGLNQDFILAKSLLKRSGIKISIFNTLYFPAGSMFYAQTECLRLLIKGLRIDDFDKEQGQISGTMAHAVERSILYFTEYTGKKWIATECSVSRGTINYKQPNYRLLNSRKVEYTKLTLVLYWGIMKRRIKKLIGF